MPNSSLSRLQRFQNHAARVVFNKHKYGRATTPLLKILHWLPIEKRITYKVACLVFKCFNDTAPSYLSRHVIPYKQERYGLRSQNDPTKLVEKRTRTTFGDRSFSSFGPRIWNSLPRDLRESGTLESFKAKLKTFLFND